MKKVIDAGSSLGEKDDSYGKELATAEKEIEADRVAIRRTWIKAAEAALLEKLKPLEAKDPDSSAFSAAENALRVLANTIDSGRGLSKDKEYLKFYAASEKKAKSHYAFIERRKSETEFSGVRAELDQAVTEASAKMVAAEGEPDPEKLQAAHDALTALERAIDSNGPAAEKDKSHQKRLALLKKKLDKDKEKIERLKAQAENKPQMERVNAAEAAFAQKMAATKGQPDMAALDAAEEACTELDSALSDTKLTIETNKKYKKHVEAMRKKLTAARATIKTKQGDAKAGEQRTQLQAALAAAKEKVNGLGKEPEADAYSAAQDAVKELTSAIDSSREAAKKSPRLAALVSSAKTTAKSLQTTLKKNKPAAAPTGNADEDVNATRLAGAVTEVKAKLKALGSKKDQVLVADARAALDALESALEDAKANPPKVKGFSKKLASAKDLLSQGRKKVIGLEAAIARSEASRSKAESARSDSSGGDDADPQAKVAEAWSAFAKRLKPLKRGTPTSDALDAALESADDVQKALDEGDSSRAGKSAKYKKYAAGIKKKLKKERSRLKKMKSQSEYSSRTK
jgi:hypothetical protein